MSRWPGKYVIGLTGNIATGKSVVRKMLEHLGAYGIDADALSHRSISKGAPGYMEVVRTFGEWILDDQGEVNRQALAKLVFSDSKLLDKLEAVVHPLVREALDLLVQRSRAPVVVIEAIKLLESGLIDMCDTVWVTHVPEWIQLVRLREKRGMSEQAARQRVAAQPAQQEKLARADVVIHNDESFESTWNQVQAAWAMVPRPAEAETQPRPRGEAAVRRGRPPDADEIAAFINLVRRPSRLLSRADIMAAFGQKAYFLLELNGEIIGLIGWQVDNLVTRADEVLLLPVLPPEQGLRLLLHAMERASADLQSEAALVYADRMLARNPMWQDAGYEATGLGRLSIRAWEEAARESFVPEAQLFFKRLREDRVMRPI
jgi:dephospho-CoA kinase